MSNKSIFRLGQLLLCVGVAYNVHQAKGQELPDRSYQIIEVVGDDGQSSVWHDQDLSFL